MSVRFSRLLRWLGSVFIAIGFTVLLMLGLQLSGGKSMAQEPVHKAHVVVQFSDGRTAVRPITWTGEISRVAALQRAGFSVEYKTMWGSDVVCNIDGDGCPADDCFCANNWWAQGQWAEVGCGGGFWDDQTWPAPPVQDGDVIAFRNSTDWGLDGKLPAAHVYVAASDALEWMRAQQASDGSYNDGFGKIGASVRALIAIASAGYDPAHWGDPSLYHFLTTVAPTQTLNYAAGSAAAAGKLTLGLAWARKPVTDFLGANLVLSLTTFYSPTTGQYGWGSADTAWAILGLHAAGADIPTKTTDFLKSVQHADGGWSWNEWGQTSEAQHTALVVQALLAAGEPLSATEIISALNFIQSARNADGGYGYQVGQGSDVDTTAFVLQALLSAGHEPQGNWCAPLSCSYLLRTQSANGSFPGYNPLYATQEAIPALMQQPYGPRAQWHYRCGVLISKTVDTPGDVGEVPLGSIVTYTIHLCNVDTSPSVAGVTMTDTLPAGVVFHSWVQQGSAQLPGGGDTITWGPHDIAGHEVYTISFTVELPHGTLRPASQVTNTAEFRDAYGGFGSASVTFATEKYRIYLPLVMRQA